MITHLTDRAYLILAYLGYIMNPPGEVLPEKLGGAGVCGPLPKTPTLLMTKICDFPYPIYDLNKYLIPYLVLSIMMKVASSKTHTQFKTRVQNHTLL